MKFIENEGKKFVNTILEATNDGYREDLGGNLEDYIDDLKDLKTNLLEPQLNNLSTHKAEAMVMDFIATIDMELEKYESKENAK